MLVPVDLPASVAQWKNPKYAAMIAAHAVLDVLVVHHVAVENKQPRQVDVATATVLAVIPALVVQAAAADPNSYGFIESLRVLAFSLLYVVDVYLYLKILPTNQLIIA
jgi:hypothetical protein